MSKLRARLERIEREMTKLMPKRPAPGSHILHILNRSSVADNPNLRLVERADTDAATYARIQNQIAWADDDYDLACAWREEIKRLDPCEELPAVDVSGLTADEADKAEFRSFVKYINEVQLVTIARESRAIAAAIWAALNRLGRPVPECCPVDKRGEKVSE